MSAKPVDLIPMTQQELLRAAEAAGQAFLDNGLRVNNLGFVLCVAPSGLAAFKLVNCEEDSQKLRVALAFALRDFAAQVEDGRIPIDVQRPA